MIRNERNGSLSSYCEPSFIHGTYQQLMAVTNLDANKTQTGLKRVSRCVGVLAEVLQ